MWNATSRWRARRRAMTLVEIVAGLTLLALLAAAIVLACAAHRRQIAQATHRVNGITIAEGLLTQWYANQGIPPVRASGTVSAAGAVWTWRTRITRREQIAREPFSIVVLEVWRRGDETLWPASVEILVADRQLRERQR